jgi:formamidopyrimidine-DNA glycosylase
VPELPEVEVLRRSLEPLLVGDRVKRVEIHHRGLREPISPKRLARLEGLEIVALRRRAKYLLIDLEEDQTLVIHLGMSGRLTLAPGRAEREPHEHLVFQLASGRKLRLRDPRRFGLALALTTSRLERDPHFAPLGVEPLSPEFSGAVLAERAVSRRGPVKSFLMDGHIVVGIGNIYASEALHQAAIHPLRSVARIASRRWDALAAAAVAVLSRAINEGGTTLNDFADGEGRSGEFQGSLEVYDRQGEPCRRCGGTIRCVTLGGRSTYYCPRCQR